MTPPAVRVLVLVLVRVQVLVLVLALVQVLALVRVQVRVLRDVARRRCRRPAKRPDPRVLNPALPITRLLPLNNPIQDASRRIHDRVVTSRLRFLPRGRGWLRQVIKKKNPL